MTRKRQQNPYTRWKPSGKRMGISPTWAGWIVLHRNFLARVVSWRDGSKTGPDIVLYFPSHRNFGANFALCLTDLTEAELVGLKQYINESIELALPVVLARDTEAKAEYDAGRDVDPRIYWPVPEVVVRPWAIGLNPESIFNRPEDAPAGNAPVPDPYRGSRDDGGGMAELDTQVDEAEDDEPTLDLSEGVCDVGTGTGDPVGLQ